MSIKRNALGKGLSALLESAETDVTSSISNADSSAALVGTIANISLSQIEANPFQPRTDFDDEALGELTASIKAQGVIQPITVRKLGYDRYQIIAGERRYRASVKAGLETIPAYIRIANDQSMLEMALVENILRKDLNAIEVGLSYQRLIDECSLTQEELSGRIGINRTTITNYIRLLKLPPEIQVAIRDNRISMSHARTLLGISDVARQLMLFKEIMNNDLNVRDVEDIVRTAAQKKSTASKSSSEAVSAEVRKIETVLSNHFGCRIKLKRNAKGKGSIHIPFSNDADLNRILELLNY